MNPSHLPTYQPSSTVVGHLATLAVYLPISSPRHSLSCTESSLASSFFVVPCLPLDWQKKCILVTNQNSPSQKKGSFFCSLVVISQLDQSPKLDYSTSCYTSREKYGDAERKVQTVLFFFFSLRNFHSNNHRITVSHYYKLLCLPVASSAARLILR